MYKISIFALLFCLLCSQSIFAQQALNDRDFQIWGIRISDEFNKNLAENLLGKLQFENADNPVAAPNDITYTYETSVIWTRGSKIEAILLTKPSRLMTARGLQVGDNFSKAVTLYGQPASSETYKLLPDSTKYIFGSEEKGIELFVSNSTQKITQIKIFNNNP